MTDVWKDYDPTDLEQRNAIIEHYHSLVEREASKLARRLPKTVSVQDLMGYGYFGLIDAVEKFEPQRGFKFETYAARRVHGSILDGLRSADWVPRSVRSRAKEIEKATVALEAQNGSHPSNAEIAEFLGVGEDYVRSAKADVEAGMLATTESFDNDDSENSVSYNSFLASPGDASQFIELDSIVSSLMAALGSMDERERIVIHLVYWENLSLADVGVVLGVTESRVCQILTKANTHIKSKLDVRVS